MILVDANLLIYAYDQTSPFHAAARAWIEDVFGDVDEVGLALESILAFLRIMTNPLLFDPAMTVDEASEIVAEWLGRPNVGVVQPTRGHVALIAEIARAGKARGPALTDVHLAALAVEHGATLCTTDRGFARFKGVRVEDPLAG